MIPHVLIELAILICPMVEINRLQLKRQQKIAVGMMFTSGLLYVSVVSYLSPKFNNRLRLDTAADLA